MYNNITIMKKNIQSSLLIPLLTVTLLSNVQSNSKMETSAGLPNTNEVIKLLQEGNQRFVNGKSIRPNQDLERIKNLQKGKTHLQSLWDVQILGYRMKSYLTKD